MADYSSPPSRSKWVALLVVLALVVVIVVQVRKNAQTPASSEAAPAGPVLKTGLGEVRQIALADSSQLILDTQTRIVTAFTQKRRWIELQRGRVRLVVTKDKIRPFFVRAGNYEVVTAGTMLDIGTDHGLTVNVLHGTAEIRRISAAGTQPSTHPVWTVGQGEKIVLPLTSGRAPVLAKATILDGQWVDDIQGFRDTPIRDVIALANPYGVDQIELADPALGELRVTGQINMRRSAATAQAIAAQLGLKVDQSHAGRIILRK